MFPSSTEAQFPSADPTAAAIPDYGLSKPENAALAAAFDAENDDSEDHDFTHVNLEAETIRLFKQTKRLFKQVLIDKATPANQRAQVANTLGSLLRSLTTQQTEIYNAERLKRLEFTIIRLLREWPQAEQDRFIAMYEAEVNV